MSKAMVLKLDLKEFRISVAPYMLIFYFALIEFYNYDEFLQISKIIMNRIVLLVLKKIK